MWEREKEREKREGVSKWNTRELYPLIKIVSIFFALLWLAAAQLSQERGKRGREGSAGGFPLPGVSATLFEVALKVNT